MRRVFIDCPEEIPCNPCESACPAGAIRIPGSIIARPVVDLEKCTGCGNCVSACPGQACFLIDPDYAPGEASVDFPYEYVPLPEPGRSVELTDNGGERVCTGRVVGVFSPPRAEKTALVRVSLPVEKAFLARGIRAPGYE
ncbi:MAG: 4Fe-4S dicluster domain-containing protein [Treponema sp.]|jgi:Fe-S-cluster-containing hydrogenase component 2|nr:4Fe-4S dicluster domain-containing protein [Treponema sp.]